MTEPQHASAERIADLLEGSLAAPDAKRLHAHLAACEQCSDLRDALLDVTAALAAEGASSEPMPIDIAATLHRAIASAGAEAASTITALDSQRRGVPRRAFSWLAAAAAVVVIGSAGVAGWRALPHGSEVSADSAARPESSVAGGGLNDAPTAQPGSGRSAKPPGVATSTPGPVAPMLVPDQVAGHARQLAAGRSLKSGTGSQRCARPLGGGLSTIVRWEGTVAILNAQTDTRTATIYDCKTALHVLFTTRY